MASARIDDASLVKNALQSVSRRAHLHLEAPALFPQVCSGAEQLLHGAGDHAVRPGAAKHRVRLA